MNTIIQSAEASNLFASLPQVLQAYISQRGGIYGIPPHELLMKMPKTLHDNPVEIYKFLKAKDISHLQATNAGGDPAAFKNWTFEDGIPNSARQDDPMRLEEYLDSQLDNHLDATHIEFGTPDPGSDAYNEAFAEAFGIVKETEPIDLDIFLSNLDGPGVSSSVTDGGKVIINATDATEQLWDGLGESLAEVGIPAAYLTFKMGFGGVLPFLRSIDGKKFRESGKYRQSTLARALKVFRDNGWKEAAKAVVIGFMIAMFPPISFFVASVGLTGVAAMGTRWLANKTMKFSGPLAEALNHVSDLLTKVHAFLKRALDAFEKIVEVVIEAATHVTKRVIKAGAKFASAVYQVSKEIAKQSVAAAKKAVTSASQNVKRIASNVSGWIFSWFSSPSYSY